NNSIDTVTLIQCGSKILAAKVLFRHFSNLSGSSRQLVSSAQLLIMSSISFADRFASGVVSKWQIHCLDYTKLTKLLDQATNSNPNSSSTQSSSSVASASASQFQNR